MPKNISVLIIGKVWPEPSSSAAGSRMMQLIQLFQSQDWEITFSTAASESDFSVDLSILGINVVPIKLNDSSFDDFVKSLNPDMVLFDRFMTEEQFGWRVAEHYPNALRILDTEDLHCLRAGRHQALKEGRKFKNGDLISDHAKREIASIYRCDLSLIISEIEMGILQDFFSVDSQLLYHIPFMLDPIDEGKRNSWIPFEQRTHFISIGNFLHEPNWDSVLFLKEYIWKNIRKQIPDAELHVYGAYPSQKVFQLNNQKEGFMIKGRAENALEVMEQSRVCLAPLRFGAGLKGKLIDAMQSGTPSVTTNIGAESMYGNLDWAGSIEDDRDAFINSAVELYKNKQLWKKSQENGFEIINRLFSKEEYGIELLKRIQEIRNGLKKHRERNFIGGMLTYHTTSSTKFMSKWIEEKNK